MYRSRSIAEQLVVERPVHARDDVRKDDAIGPAGDRNAGERVGVPDELGAGAVHGAQPGAAGEHERAVDIEEDELHTSSVKFSVTSGASALHRLLNGFCDLQSPSGGSE